MSDVELDYNYLTNRALKGVLRDVLSITQELGAAPGEHHFYIEFATGADGVDIPSHLKQAYPERMTIVLQHQFRDLAVDEDGFRVTLWFKGEPSLLVIPYEAVLSFTDPSVQFGLRFDAPIGGPQGEQARAGEKTEDSGHKNKDARRESDAPDGQEKQSDDEEDAEGGADVVSLDAFRKK